MQSPGPGSLSALVCGRSLVLFLHTVKAFLLGYCQHPYQDLIIILVIQTEGRGRQLLKEGVALQSTVEEYIERDDPVSPCGQLAAFTRHTG